MFVLMLFLGGDGEGLAVSVDVVDEDEPHVVGSGYADFLSGVGKTLGILRRDFNPE